MTEQSTTRAIIAKSARARAAVRHLHDYAEACATFSWEQERAALCEPGHVNIADIALDLHVRAGRGDHMALRWRGRDDAHRDLTFAELKASSERFSGLLRRLGVGAGDVVAVLMPRRPELFAAAFGTWRNRSLFCPLFAAFGPEPVVTRLKLAGARLLVTTVNLYRRKVAGIRQRLQHLDHVLLVDAPGSAELPPGTLGYREQPDPSDAPLALPATHAEDPAILHFTSGTTGPPKGALHVHDAVIAHHATARSALDLGPGDVYWCTADPGWVTGTSYGIIAPLAVGATVLVDEEDFEPARWYRLLEAERVAVWYTSPTALRMLMHAGPALAKARDLDALRLIASVGEPLNPDAIAWARQTLGRPVHDGWWQTETGAIMISNFAAQDIKPGAMGRPVPGIEAAVVRRDDSGALGIVEQADEIGELALRAGWPSMFRGYLNDDVRYRSCFRDGWYLSGDLVRRDADGYFWFVGRGDDVIKSAGHLISPFEVESALHEHPAIAEVAVVGKSDPLVGALVVAYVTLNADIEPGEALKREILAHGRRRLGAALAPRDIVFRPSLPKTESGKIKRRLLAEEQGDDRPEA
jgi:acetyl-CoA synthetase